MIKKTYIYKKKFKYSIGDIAQNLMRTFAHKFDLPKEDIISLPNKDIDIDSLDPNKIYFQIVNVQPYFGSEDEDRTTLFEQNFNISQFISEIPMSKDGGKITEDDPSKLMKKKTVFKCSSAFPYITNRISVVSCVETLLSPIECAIEHLQQRVDQFKKELSCPTIRKNNLQSLLTGTLATTVNVGPMKFCDVFLNKSDYEPQFQQKLKEVMAQMLVISEVGLKENAKIISKEQLLFQAMLESKYQEISKMFKENYGVGIDWQKITQEMILRQKIAKEYNQVQERKLKYTSSTNSFHLHK